MNEHPEWTQQAKALLDESARDLDAATLARLNRARQAALASRRTRLRQPWFLPAGLASACAVLLAVAVWYPPHPTRHSQPAAVASGDANGDQDALNDDDEFFEDLDFYVWLEAQEQDDDG